MIYLIRHPQPAIEKGICYGQSDLALRSGYQVIIDNIQATISFPPSFLLWTCPLKRCNEFAKELFPNIRPVLIKKELLDMDFGKWEMQKWSGIDTDDLKSWIEDFVHQNPYQGESFLDLYQRVSVFWDAMNKEKDIVMVTHDNVIRCILCRILSIPLSRAFSLFIPFGNVIRIHSFNSDNYKIEFLPVFNYKRDIIEMNYGLVENL
ncbi:MAG: alpha-ribazole phosphatase family protein [Hyphomicrobiales bacterium]